MPRSKLRRFSSLTVLSILIFGCSIAAAAASNVMPAPAELRIADGRFAVTANLTTAISGHDDARLRAALTRALRRWEERTGFTFARTATGELALADKTTGAQLTIECQAAAAEIPALGEDESYTLEVKPGQIALRAPTVLGAMRGLETLLQALDGDGEGWFVPAMTIRDRPRFAWRGLLVDPCRHWLPVETIKRTLDAMAVVKLNVLHWHLTEDQGFRIETKKYPRLHELGSDGLYYTQEQVRDIVAYAAARGIRVVPEFDVPGHATAWVVGHPEIASAPGPYSIERRWGVKDPVLDPTNEKTYELLDGFFGEMATLFPDAYFHIGGDENNGKQWNANPTIQAFITAHELKNNEGLHTYFNTRVRAMLAKQNKKLVGWDEILHPDLPKDSVVHSWRGAQGLAAAARGGFQALLSNGYYLDHSLPAAKHYLNDPAPADSPLTPEQQQRILGGEACMWGEWVGPETIDSRIWPRAAAIAERLWSPREVNDVADMYRRLAVTSRRLEEAGALHEKNPAAMLRRYAGDNLSEAQFAAVQSFANAVEAGALGTRARAAHGTITQPSPLTNFADCVKPESDTARHFAEVVNAWVFATGARDARIPRAIDAQLAAWQAASVRIATELAPLSPRLAELAPTARALADVCTRGRELLTTVAEGKPHDSAWAADQMAALNRAAASDLGVTLSLLVPLKYLVAAAVAEPTRATTALAAWRAQVEKIANPPPSTERRPTLPAAPAPKS
jgi:hexosaminidase